MIKIRCENVLLEFCNHVNVLGGDTYTVFNSATKKSFLFNTLVMNRNNNKLQSNCTIALLDSPMEFETTKIDSDTCIILDEANFAPSILDKMFQVIRENNAYVVIIGRLLVRQFEYAVDAIYSIKYESGCFSNYRVFNNAAFKRVSSVFTEDSTAVASIYTDCINVEVVPVFGRSNFYKYIKREVAPLIIADIPKFGNELLTLIWRVNNSNSDVNWINGFFFSSFEQILASLFFENYAEIDKESKSSFDRENYFEKFLNNNSKLWNKKDVIQSLKNIKECYDFMDSVIIRDLINCYKDNLNCEYSFCIEISDFVNKYSDEFSNSEEIQKVQAF